MTRRISLVITEGALEVVAAEKLLTELNLRADECHFVDQRGRSNFWPKAKKYNEAAKVVGPILGLADLEAERCASQLLHMHLPNGLHADFVLRVAVRMLESWLLADRVAMADYLRVPIATITRSPESLPNPKQSLVNHARRSTSREIRADIVPDPATTGVVGKNYTGRMSDFIRNHWRPLEAQSSSDSLKRAIVAIQLRCAS